MLKTQKVSSKQENGFHVIESMSITAINLFIIFSSSALVNISTNLSVVGMYNISSLLFLNDITDEVMTDVDVLILGMLIQILNHQYSVGIVTKK